MKEMVADAQISDSIRYQRSSLKKIYTHLKNKLLKMFPEVFKEDLTPEDRLNIEPVKITPAWP